MNMLRRWYAAAVVAACALLAGVLAVGALRTPSTMTVSFLDVGQGDAIYVDLPDHGGILIDGGRDSSILSELGRVMPWWKRRIDYLVVTHPDRDHFGGLLPVLEKYEIGRAYMSTVHRADPYYGLFLDQLKAASVPVELVAQGQRVSWPSGVALDILWPPPNYTGDDNERSIVADVSWGEINYLLTADIGFQEERNLVERYPDLSAEVLKVGHHGSRYSSDASFLATVRPRFCIISAGQGNRYGHPHADALGRLRAGGCEIRATADEGSIHLATDGLRVWPVHFPLSLRFF